uniref:Uncharacterized protein n=1 Tax=Parascaris equorum TaxID=6256 RepID=A0A914RJZ2_PAREQ
MEPQDKVSFMTSLLRALNLTKLIIVSPSASGAYSMPFVIQHQRYLSGFVAVEACCSDGYEWVNFEVPTVIIYGGASAALSSNNSSELTKIPENNLVIIPDAPHAVYTKKPIEFMTVLNYSADAAINAVCLVQSFLLSKSVGPIADVYREIVPCEGCTLKILSP